MSLDPTGFTLGTVVGKLDGIEQQLKLLRDDVNKRLDNHGDRIGKLERAGGNWRWLERVGAIVGGALAGWFGGKAG